MKLIEKEENLLNALQHNLSLISSKIIRISIYSENSLTCIDIEFELLYEKDNNKILLRFIDISEYSFYYLSNRYFYNIEIYKFFKIDNTFYISFDPTDEREIMSDEDQDYVKARSVEGYFL